MANFNSLLGSTAFEAPKPRNFPEGIYPGVISKTPSISVRKMQEKDKMVVSITVKPTGWPDDLSEEAKEGLSLEGKTFSKDFIIDKEKIEAGDKSDLWPLDQFLRSIKVTGGSTYEELLPNAVGAEVQFQLGLRTYKSKSGEDGEANDVKKVIGT